MSRSALLPLPAPLLLPALLAVAPVAGCTAETGPLAFTPGVPLPDAELSHALIYRTNQRYDAYGYVGYFLNAWLLVTAGTPDCATWAARAADPSLTLDTVAWEDTGVLVSLEASIASETPAWPGTYRTSRGMGSGDWLRYEAVVFGGGTLLAADDHDAAGFVRLDEDEGAVVRGYADTALLSGAFEAVDCGTWGGRE